MKPKKEAGQKIKEQCKFCRHEFSEKEKKTGKTIHCEGSSFCFQCSNRAIHHGRVTYKCRKCMGYLGCDVCAHLPDEIVCTRCQDWGTKEAYEKHGRMLTRSEAREGLGTILRQLKTVPHALEMFGDKFGSYKDDAVKDIKDWKNYEKKMEERRQYLQQQSLRLASGGQRDQKETPRETVKEKPKKRDPLAIFG